MSTDNTICDPAYEFLVETAKDKLRTKCTFNPQLEYFPAKDRRRKCDYADLVVEMVFLNGNQKLCRIAGKEHNKKSMSEGKNKNIRPRRTLVLTESPAQTSLRLDNYLKVNGPIVPALTANAKIWDGIQDIPDIVFMPQIMPYEFRPTSTNSSSDIHIAPLNQMLSVLVCPVESGMDSTKGDNSVVLANTRTCLYFLREIYSKPLTDNRQQLESVARTVKSIKTFVRATLDALDRCTIEVSSGLSQESKWCIFVDWDAPVATTLEMIEMAENYRLERLGNQQLCDVLKVKDLLNAMDCLAEQVSVEIAYIYTLPGSGN